jgi:hypothetical protein
MNLNDYVTKVYKYGLTPGFEKQDIKESVKDLSAEVNVLYKSLFQSGTQIGANTYIEENMLIAKNLANMFIVLCEVAKHYNIDLDIAFNKQLDKRRSIEKHIP